MMRKLWAAFFVISLIFNIVCVLIAIQIDSLSDRIKKVEKKTQRMKSQKYFKKIDKT